MDKMYDYHSEPYHSEPYHSEPYHSEPYYFEPYEFPRSEDGKYTCLLDDGQILRSRREQLGLSVKQVAEKAGLQFSQYQRLESGSRFFSGCSMRVGLSICAVLLLNPFDFFRINVHQPDPATMKPREPFDADIPKLPKKVGRKALYRDIMTIYANHFSLILPHDVLSALGKPQYIKALWIFPEKRLLFYAVGSDTPLTIETDAVQSDTEKGNGIHAAEAVVVETDAAHLADVDAENIYAVPSSLYNSKSPIVLPKLGFSDKIRKYLGWNDDVYAVECRTVVDIGGQRCILCDLKTARLTNVFA